MYNSFLIHISLPLGRLRLSRRLCVSHKVLSEIYWAKFSIHGHSLKNMGNASCYFLLPIVAQLNPFQRTYSGGITMMSPQRGEN